MLTWIRTSRKIAVPRNPVTTPTGPNSRLTTTNAPAPHELNPDHTARKTTIRITIVKKRLRIRSRLNSSACPMLPLEDQRVLREVQPRVHDQAKDQQQHQRRVCKH